ncbi:ABC transporter ATP-binding protein [Streptococcus equi subsp. zooepidemicus]|uniref:ATP-binding cassette domain-containing protein n=1 Tax=Streptococcus equi TaxID=1336 RepID=UPI00021747D1|nr:ABC transporter ATP-binding protein [Streptococcus equi]AEJ25017.1 ATP-binding/membrane spanning protein - multidrug resistance [Streptococcus equi subsp. zooepidemicus ATCC 35246]AIA67816.1 ABC transporter ATP-binding protein [Streptococcus equi subsp. zooepidemicus CY]KIS11911.1 ABC transporter ATP-binding protein/permease [Streptococcus equi subsp. zooepidemicus Sz57]MBR7684488.1 ABC transporter ATP-binding protein [Streptococcus equi subsp. zooepidemicus]MBR7753577.1 ABC transporter ATP
MFKYFNKYLVTLTLVACVLNSLVFLIEPLITSKIFDLTSLNSHQNTLAFLGYGLTLYVVLYSVMFIANLLINHIMTIGCGRIRLRLYQNLILNHREMNHDKKISMLTQDVEYYLWNHISPSILLVSHVSNVLLLSAYLLSKNMLIGLIFIACAFVFLVVQHVIGQKAEQKGSELAVARQKLLGLLSDVVAGHSTLIQNQALFASLKQVKKQSEHYESSRQAFEIFRSFFTLLAHLMLFISQFLPIFLGLALTLLGVKLRTTDLIAMFIAATRLEQPLKNIVDDIFRLNGAKAIAKHFETLLEQPIPKYQSHAMTGDPFECLDGHHLAKSFAGRTLFFDLSFHFEKGKKYLIKGPSGSGKSTLFKLILQEMSPDEGTLDMVLAGGRTTDNYHHRIGLIAQSPYLFNDSIRYNLTLGEAFSDELLLEKLEQVGLTNEFDDILNYQIVNNGENISGGQKTRLEIARSLIRQKDVLLADEVTAPLDVNNAKTIRQLLFSLPVTVIEIAHHIDDTFIYDGDIDLS